MTAEPAVFDVVIGLGSNLGDRRATLAGAVAALGALGPVRAVSALYESAALGPPQPDYLNAAVRLESTLPPRALLSTLLELERAAGRTRRLRWGARTLDLDVLWIAGRVVDEPGLEVPHPELTRRAFALLPLLDVASDAADPRTGVAYASLSADRSTIRRLVDAAPTRWYQPRAVDMIRGGRPTGGPLDASAVTEPVSPSTPGPEPED